MTQNPKVDSSVIKAQATKLTIGALKDAIKRAITAVGSKEAIVTISMVSVYVEAKGPEGYAKVTVPVEDGNIGSPGHAKITASAANAVLGHEARDAKVTITPDSNGLVVRFSGSRLKLHNADEGVALFAASVETHVKKELLNTTGRDLKEAFRAAVKFTAKHDVRAYLMGVNIVNNSGKLLVNSSSAHAFHRLDTDLPLVSPKFDLNIIIPNRAAEAIGSVFGTDEQVQVNLLGKDKNLIEFVTADMVWMSNLIAGRFPDATPHFNNESTANDFVVVNKESILQAINLVRVMDSKGYLAVTFDKDAVRIASPDGEQVSKVKPLAANGNAMEFGLKTELISEAIEAIPSDTVMLKKDGSSQDAIIYIRPMKDEQPVQNWIALTAPYKL